MSLKHSPIMGAFDLDALFERIATAQEEQRLVGCSRDTALARIRKYAQEQGFELIPVGKEGGDAYVCRKLTRRWRDIAAPSHFKQLQFHLGFQADGTLITISLSQFSWARLSLTVLLAFFLGVCCYWLSGIKTDSPAPHQQPLLMPLVSLIGWALVISALTEALSDFPFRPFVEKFYASSRSEWEGLEIQLSKISNPLANLELLPLVLYPKNRNVR